MTRAGRHADSLASKRRPRRLDPVFRNTRENPMRAARGLVAAFVVLLLAGPVFADARDDAKKQLLGTWATKQKLGDKELTAQLTFEDNNNLVLKILGADMNFTFKGKYSVIDATNIEATITINDAKRTEKWTFEVTKDTLKLTEKSGVARTYSRVK
jgi:uncharacterized protein (TIGR03066 family)